MLFLKRAVSQLTETGTVVRRTAFRAYLLKIEHLISAGRSLSAGAGGILQDLLKILYNRIGETTIL